MRILLTTRALGYRGTPKVVADYARILSNGNEVAIWAWESGGESEVTLKREGFKVWVGEAQFESVCKFRPHIVNIHRPGVYDYYETCLLKRFCALGAKCIETSTFGRVDKSIAKYVSASIQISKWDLLQWKAWGGERVTHGVYCPNPVNTNVFRRASATRIALRRKAWGIPLSAAGVKSPFVIGRIGNTSWGDFGPLVELLLRRYDNVFIVHVQDHCNKISAKLAHHPRVRCIDRLVGYEELVDFYSSCDVCVSMSRIGESFGLVNAEAIACETPVFALSAPLHCNGVLEVVAASHGGVVVADPKKIVNLVGAAIQDGIAFRENVNAACHRMAEEYSFSVVGNRLEKIFNGVLHDVPSMLDDKGQYDSLGEIMSLTYGAYPFYTKLLMCLYYTPWAYQLLQYYKLIRRKLHI